MIRLTKEKREKTQINKIRGEERDIATNATEREISLGNILCTIFPQIGKTSKPLNTHTLSELNNEHRETLSRLHNKA
jgi:hypothetical protein